MRAQDVPTEGPHKAITRVETPVGLGSTTNPASHATRLHFAGPPTPTAFGRRARRILAGRHRELASLNRREYIGQDHKPLLNGNPDPKLAQQFAEFFAIDELDRGSTISGGFPTCIGCKPARGD